MRFYLPEGGVGDAIALTATVREYHKRFPDDPVYVSTMKRYDDVFYGNPHLSTEISGGRIVALSTEVYNDRGNIAVSFGLQAGIDVVDSTPEIYLFGEEKAQAAQLLAGAPNGRKVILVDPWARASTRRWRFERWDEVVADLRERYYVVAIGKRRSDYYWGTRTSRELPVDLDLTHKTGLRVTAALMQRADLFLGMDSGGAHLAASVGCPAAIIYSRSAWHSRAYWNTTAITVPSHPCAGQLCDRLCGNPFGFCLDRLQAERVLEHVDLALRRFPRGRVEAPEAAPEEEGGDVASGDWYGSEGGAGSPSPRAGEEGYPGVFRQPVQRPE